MKEIALSKRPWQVSGKPSSGDASLHLTAPARLTCGGVTLAVAVRCDADLSAIHSAASQVRYPTRAKRTNGLPVKNRSFGFTTRNVIRGDFCSAAGLARETPEAHAVLCDFSKEVEKLYRAVQPGLYEAHRFSALSRVSSEFRLGESLFTSGNANRNNAVAYHYDTGNFKGVWSGMIVLRRGATGGELVLPEYGAAVYLDDGDCFFFDGQGILHGVTPIELASDAAYRVSLVYYSLEQAWQCIPADGELQRIREEKTKREQAIVGRRGYRGGKPEFAKRRDLPRQQSRGSGESLGPSRHQ